MISINMIKNRILSLLVVLFVAISAYAQDARQRTTETIVQDVLAAMPAANQADLYVQMKDLAQSAPASVESLASMLKPASAGSNNLIEYAIGGIVHYVTDPANKQYLAPVKSGFEKAAANCTDSDMKAFLLSQVRLLSEFVQETPAQPTVKEMLSSAKSLLKSSESKDKSQAMWLFAEALGEKSASKVLKALKSDDKAFRMTALRSATSFADEAFLTKLAKLYPKLSTSAKADVLNWIGSIKAVSQTALVLSEVKSGNPLATTAIDVAGRLGGDNVKEVLFDALASDDTREAAMKALYSFNGDIDSSIISRMAGAKGSTLDALMGLAAKRRVKETSKTIISSALTNKAALSALPAVVGEGDADVIAAMLDKADAASQPQVVKALTQTLKGLSADDCYNTVMKYISKAKNPENYYPLVAQTGTDAAVETLVKAYKDGSATALKALSKTDNYKAAAVLLEASAKDDSLLGRYIQLVDKYVTDGGKKCFDYSQALDMAQTDKTKNTILKSLSKVHTMKAFLLAGKYLDNKETAYSAANTAKAIAEKTTEEIDYNQFCNILKKSSEIIGAHGSADDGYAVDAIKKLLDEAKPFEKFELSEEEKKAGFEVLFDGTDLSKWTGDFEGYTPLNGTINVTASYGDTRNLYTKKEYTDFIFRFEFCFLKPGVNNGVGIRTPMGVDAAYHGMCEVQILDHDAPIYKNLREYQVHGSVYGIVPAKRIVHKPLGEWSTQEIKVVGNRITVTVNGEVIVDADIRKACKGRNVAPDGSEKNPYTVDKRNHPGMFNKSGHIGFLGHGAGLRFRNVRVLDLSK